MSDVTLEAKENLIDKQAEAAKAAEQLAEIEHQETIEAQAEILEALPPAEAVEEITEEEVTEEWLLSKFDAIKEEIAQLRLSITEQLSAANQQLQSQLLESVTQIFQTAIATLAIQQSTPQASQTPETPEPPPGPESAEQMQEPKETPEVKEPKHRTRKI